MASSLSFVVSFLSFFLFSILFTNSNATVPANATFKYVNEGEFGIYIVEYGGDYRVLSIASSPFQLCFYNTTPNSFTLALRMGTTRSESLRCWVWEANRGNPVGEDATFAFGKDGNLVLADADGRIAWQTNTANKGVVGFKLLPNGNMVLHNSKGKFIWQSFDHPTDTLLVGQSLKVGGATKLVSRASEKVNSDGPYSFVLEPRRLALYYKTKNSPKPYLYFTNEVWAISGNGTLESVTFNSSPETEGASAYELAIAFHILNSSDGGTLTLGRPKYNSMLTYLRLGVDGNLRLFTYFDEVDWGAWEETFTLFARESIWDTECQLPERCGNFGLCENDQCVACPTASGLTGWSKDCKPKKLSGCGPNSFQYYKVDKVDHFLSKYTEGEGPMRVSDCGNKCTKDCKCLGYFYRKDTSRCWITYDLKTLTKVVNSTHVGYIKVPKN